jgi:glycerophosphoryl diester phosphodiesterase
MLLVVQGNKKIKSLISLILILIYISGIFLCTSEKQKVVRPVLGKSNTIFIAHRGYREKFPENTMQAFNAAITQGWDGVEVDVQILADNTLIAFHDETTIRTTNEIGIISIHKLTWKRISTLDAGSWFSQRFKGVKIPKIEELVRKFGNSNYIIFDVKTHHVALPLIALLKKEKIYQKIIFAANKEYILEIFHKKWPEIPRLMWLNSMNEIKYLKKHKIEYARPPKNRDSLKNALLLKKSGYKIVLGCRRAVNGTDIVICSTQKDYLKKKKELTFN